MLLRNSVFDGASSHSALSAEQLINEGQLLGSKAGVKCGLLLSMFCALERTLHERLTTEYRVQLTKRFR